MNAIRSALALAAALLAAACLPVTTKAPLGSTATPGAEPALIGTWKGQVSDGEGPSYFHILPGADGAMTVLAVMPAHGNDNGSWSEFAAHPAKLGSYRYLNVRSVSSDGKPAGKDEAEQNIPVLYKINGDKLTLYLIGEKEAKAAIKAGRIEGTVEPGDFGDTVIAAAPAGLDAFFASREGAKLFTEKLTTLTKLRE